MSTAEMFFDETIGFSDSDQGKSQKTIRTHQPAIQEKQEEVSEVAKNKNSKSGKIEFKRLSIALPEKVAEVLEELAILQGITQVDALKRAILTEALLQNEVHKGADILIRNPDGTIERILFR
jgi:hypothetical protein